MSAPFSDKSTVAIPADEQRAERLAALLDRYMRDLEAGGIPPDVEALVAEHPDLADELRSYADSLKLLHQMTAGIRPLPTRAEPSTAGMTARRLGDYEIEREIGRGGMGIVYEARQLSLNRQVALKVLPFAAMLDEKQIARFRNEAQAAAQLHHPNIVPVHAVGQERGVHFFAMQYVPGQSLEMALQELRKESDFKPPAPPVDGPSRDTTPSEGKSAGRGGGSYGGFLSEPAARDTVPFTAFSTRASTRSRGYCHSVARLMIQAADAIQHAHEYGVVHRDVKPSNLLLDRTGKLWVTDFGLARMQSDTGVTITGDVVGTLRYMSPEQAAGATALVDARADVYSLGATLYELLTLRPAHSGDNRQEILRHIETREPPAPRSFNPAIPLDLETITLRAMAKTREERYASAQEFSSDLRLFLEGKPTIARRPTVLDRAGKWALRHRRAVSLAAACLLVVSLVSATAAIMIAREKARTDEALDETRTSLAKAEAANEMAHGAVEELGRMASELATVQGAEPQTRRMFAEALAYYREFIAQNADDPRLERELASASFKAATLAEALGERREALALCRQAIEQFAALLKKSPEDAELQLKLARCYSNLGLLLAHKREVEQALDVYADAVHRQQVLVSRPNASPAAVRDLADTQSNLGLLLAELGRTDAARRALSGAIGLIKRLAAAAPEDLRLRHDLANTYNILSFVQRDLDWDQAELSCREAISLLETLASESPGTPAFRADLAICLNNLGAILAHGSNWDDACESYRRAIGYQEQLVRQAGAVVAHRRDLAVTWNNLGQALQATGAQGAAVDAYDSAREIIELLVADYPDEPSFRSLCGGVYNNRAMALEASGQLDKALAAYDKAVAEQRVAYDRAPQVAQYREFLSKHYFNYGRALRAAGRLADAAEMALARRELWRGDGPRLGQVAVELALAAVAAREVRDDGNSDAQGRDQLADRLEAETAATLRDAAAAGGNLAELQGERAFQLLRDAAIWTMIKTPAKDDAPLPN